MKKTKHLKRKYNRKHKRTSTKNLRYPSNLTFAEWARIRYLFLKNSCVGRLLK